jgi:hypothetical protein
VKRKNFRNRVTAVPLPFVRPIARRQPESIPSAYAHGRQSSRGRRIFILKDGKQLPTTNATGRKIQRFLIFDDHPDSLRLVFGPGTHSPIDLYEAKPAKSLRIILLSILALGVLLEILWLFF